jgi:copper homeostasis protein
VHRLLTSGQEDSALIGAPLIADLVRKADGRIVIMPGGGVNERTIARVAAATGADEFHFTAMVASDSPAIHRNPVPKMGGVLSRSEYQRSETSQARIGQIIDAVR